MDTGRLKAVLDELIAEATKQGLAAALATFETAYQQYTAQPNAATGAAVTQAYEALKVVLTASLSNKFSPSKFRILETIGGSENVGLGLLNRFEEAQSGQQLPANVFAKIQQIKKEGVEFIAGITQLSARLGSMGITVPVLADGDGEIGVTFPELNLTEDLQSLGKEISELDFAIGTLSELYEDGTGSIEIKGIDQGSPLVFHLVASPQLVHVVRYVTSSILGIITSIQAYRTSQAMIAKLLSQGAVSEAEKKLREAETSVKEAEKLKIDLEIKALREKLVAESPMPDGPRKNELGAQTFHALVYIAQRIDKGVDWEASANETVPVIAEGESDSAEMDKRIKAIEDTKKLEQGNAIMFRQVQRSGEGVLNLDSHSDAPDFRKAVETNREKKKGKRRK